MNIREETIRPFYFMGIPELHIHERKALRLLAQLIDPMDVETVEDIENLMETIENHGGVDIKLCRNGPKGERYWEVLFGFPGSLLRFSVTNKPKK